MKARALVTLLALTVSHAAFAAEEEGALVEKIAVKNRLFTTAGRFELGLNLGFAVLSRLTEHYTANLDLSFNLVDTFAIEVLAGGSYTRHTSLARDVGDQFSTNMTKTVDDLSDLWEMVGNAVLALRWQPLYGKIGGALQDLLLGNPIHFQFYISAGGGAGYFIRESLVICNHKSGGMCDDYFDESKVGPIVTLGLGFRFFLPTIGNHHSVRLEIRDFSYLDNYYVGVNRDAALNQANPTGNGTPGPTGITNLVQVHIGYSYMF